jgi:voltage-gated sodium channel
VNSEILTPQKNVGFAAKADTPRSPGPGGTPRSPASDRLQAKSGFAAMAEEQQAAKEETQRRADELRLQAAGISQKATVMSEKYWEDYALRKDGFAKLVYAVHRVLSSTQFDAGIGIIIILNSVTIGLQSEAEVKGIDISDFIFIDNIFLAIYTIELGLRFFAYGFHCLDNGWVRFDAVLVGFGICTSLLELVFGGASKENLGPLMVLRVLRLLRLARAVRLFSQFKALWMLVRGLLSSAATMCYTFALMFLMLYLFANMAMEIITKDADLRESEPEFDALVVQFFPDLFTTMITLIQFVTLDSIGEIYRVMIPHKPVQLCIFFCLFLMVVSISLMNLVTAVIVEGSFEQAKSDKEVSTAYKTSRLKRLIPEIRELFHQMDADGSGDLDMDEILNAPPDIQEYLSKIMQTDDLVELFEILDVDGSGSLDIDEFVDGICKLATSEQPMEQLRVQKSLNLIRHDQKAILHYVKDVEDNLREEIRNGLLCLSEGRPLPRVERLGKAPPPRRVPGQTPDPSPASREPESSSSKTWPFTAAAF